MVSRLISALRGRPILHIVVFMGECYDTESYNYVQEFIVIIKGQKMVLLGME